jgi:hypothetical protein
VPGALERRKRASIQSPVIFFRLIPWRVDQLLSGRDPQKPASLPIKSITEVAWFQFKPQVK